MDIFRFKNDNGKEKKEVIVNPFYLTILTNTIAMAFYELEDVDIPIEEKADIIDKIITYACNSAMRNIKDIATKE